MRMTATYSPEDNKLRLYSPSRLDAETYARVKGAGFLYAAKQELFVAPMWTPEREDLLLALCEEIEDEDTSLVDRAEERSERFSEYSDNRAADAERAHQAVAAIADGIPLGQPILVGHHSERRARKDAQRIEDGMRKAVRMWDTAAYWTDRAAGAIRNAKYKERPDVRARRIKGLEADKRKQDRFIQEAETWLKLWTACSQEQNPELQAAAALRCAAVCHLRLPRKAGDREDCNQNPSAYDALTGSFSNLYAPRTLAEVLTAALTSFPRLIAHHGRWAAHFENRLCYERAMLAASSGTEADKTRPEKGGACRCWASPRGGWSYIQKVNRVSVTVFDTYHQGGPTFPRTMPFDKLTGLMSAAEVQAKRAAGLLLEAENRIEFFLLPEPPSPSPIHPTVEEAEPDSDPEASLRALWTAEGVSVERQEELIASVTAKAQPGAMVGPFRIGERIEAMRGTLKAGAAVVTAPQLFPTPAKLAARMAELAHIEPGQQVLEPSAGTGVLCEAIKTAQPAATVAAACPA